jgi:hypothetical protein
LIDLRDGTRGPRKMALPHGLISKVNLTTSPVQNSSSSPCPNSNSNSNMAAVVVSDKELSRFDHGNPDTIELIRKAQESDAADRQLTLFEALKKYKKAVFWSCALSTALVMEGYDIVIVKYPPFSWI